MFPQSWIKSCCWLIKNKNLGGMHQGACKIQTPFHSPGKILCKSITKVTKFNETQKIFCTFLDIFFRNTVQLSKIMKIFIKGELFVKTIILTPKTKNFSDKMRIFRDVFILIKNQPALNLLVNLLKTNQRRLLLLHRVKTA